tara:strand:+ start:1898 stop:2326 length:429 start_codon:yes stop_codon:yes gene_type:complete
VFDKTIKLTGEYPSDFKPTVPVQEVQQYFDAYSFHDGRMIGGSKTGYRSMHPDDLIIFNANVLMPGYGKVWYGDLNLTEDYKTLKKIAESLNSTLYILWEMDGRFGLEMKQLNELFDKAVWNTDEDKPTNEWYRNKVKGDND